MYNPLLAYCAWTHKPHGGAKHADDDEHHTHNQPGSIEAEAEKEEDESQPDGLGAVVVRTPSRDMVASDGAPEAVPVELFGIELFGSPGDPATANERCSAAELGGGFLRGGLATLFAEPEPQRDLICAICTSTMRPDDQVCVTFHCTILHCITVQYNTAQHSTSQHSTILQCSAVQCSAVQCRSVQCSIVAVKLTAEYITLCSPLPDGQVYKVACGHTFHSACVMRWGQQCRNDCPTCRGEMVVDDDEPLEDGAVVVEPSRGDKQHSIGKLMAKLKVSNDVLHKDLISQQLRVTGIFAGDGHRRGGGRKPRHRRAALRRRQA